MHIPIIMSLLGKEKIFPHSSDRWSFARTVHPAVRHALYYAESSTQRAIICARYELSSDIGQITDFGSTAEVLKVYNSTVDEHNRRQKEQQERRSLQGASPASSSSFSSSAAAQVSRSSSSSSTGAQSFGAGKRSARVALSRFEEAEEIEEEEERKFDELFFGSSASNSINSSNANNGSTGSTAQSNNNPYRERIKQLLKPVVRGEEDDEDAVLQERRKFVKSAMNASAKVPMTAEQKQKHAERKARQRQEEQAKQQQPGQGGVRQGQQQTHVRNNNHHHRRSSSVSTDGNGTESLESAITVSVTSSSAVVHSDAGGVSNSSEQVVPQAEEVVSVSSDASSVVPLLSPLLPDVQSVSSGLSVIAMDVVEVADSGCEDDGGGDDGDDDGNMRGIEEAQEMEDNGPAVTASKVDREQRAPQPADNDDSTPLRAPLTACRAYYILICAYGRPITIIIAGVAPFKINLLIPFSFVNIGGRYIDWLSRGRYGTHRVHGKADY